MNPYYWGLMRELRYVLASKRRRFMVKYSWAFQTEQESKRRVNKLLSSKRSSYWILCVAQGNKLKLKDCKENLAYGYSFDVYAWPSEKTAGYTLRTNYPWIYSGRRVLSLFEGNEVFGKVHSACLWCCKVFCSWLYRAVCTKWICDVFERIIPIPIAVAKLRR